MFQKSFLNLLQKFFTSQSPSLFILFLLELELEMVIAFSWSFSSKKINRFTQFFVKTVYLLTMFLCPTNGILQFNYFSRICRTRPLSPYSRMLNRNQIVNVCYFWGLQNINWFSSHLLISLIDSFEGILIMGLSFLICVLFPNTGYCPQQFMIVVESAYPHIYMPFSMLVFSIQCSFSLLFSTLFLEAMAYLSISWAFSFLDSIFWEEDRR